MEYPTLIARESILHDTMGLLITLGWGRIAALVEWELASRLNDSLLYQFALMGWIGRCR